MFCFQLKSQKKSNDDELFVPYIRREYNIFTKKECLDGKIYYKIDDGKILEKYKNFMHMVYLIDYFLPPISVKIIKESKPFPKIPNFTYTKEGQIGDYDCINSYSAGEFDKIVPMTMKEIEEKRKYIKKVIGKEF
jgi:hypothetical protein